MIITDFDGVLFNDERFKRDYKRLFRRLGIPSSIHQAAYRESKSHHPSGAYHHGAHIASMRRKMPLVNAKRTEKEVFKLLRRSAQYLYHDAKPFLSYWQGRGQRIALVSSGFVFQKKKVRACGLLSFFRPAVITGTALKVEPVRDIVRRFPEERFVFMDDRLPVVDAIKKHFPDIFVIQVVRRKEQARSKNVNAVVRDLGEARKLAEKYFGGRSVFQKGKSPLGESRH